MASDKDSQDPKELPLVAHLMELRDRVVRCLICVVIVFLPAFYFSHEIYDFVLTPLTASLTNGQHLIAIKPLDAFTIPLTLAFMVALFISIPYIMHQVWAFVAPGLYKNEIRVTIPILVSSIILFYVGMAFAYKIMLPILFNFTVGTTPDNVTYSPEMSSVYDLMMRMFLVFGFVFEVPVATVLLIMAGVITPEKMAEHRGYVVIACFTIGMLVTPPDVFSQSVVAIPMWMLFESGLLAGKLMKRKSDAADKTKAQS